MTKFLERRNGVRAISRNIVVFYHANCTDGFSAAWAAWKKFGAKAEYIATFHEDPIPAGIIGKEIYTVDMTFPEDVTRKLMRTNKHVTAIDHHITSKKTTMLTHKYSYALNHSGATLAWKYFHPDAPIPRFLLSVEDMDIWKLKIKGTKELYAYLELYDFDFKTWSKLVKDFEDSAKRKYILRIGAMILKYEDNLTERQMAKNAQLVRFEGHTVYAVNVTGPIMSEMCHRLAGKLPPFALGWSVKNTGMVNVSLRGVGDIDVAKLAEKYGGGGHKHAAAFRLKSIKDIPWKPVKRTVNK